MELRRKRKSLHQHVFFFFFFFFFSLSFLPRFLFPPIPFFPHFRFRFLLYFPFSVSCIVPTREPAAWLSLGPRKLPRSSSSWPSACSAPTPRPIYHHILHRCFSSCTVQPHGLCIPQDLQFCGQAQLQVDDRVCFGNRAIPHDSHASHSCGGRSLVVTRGLLSPQAKEFAA